MKENSFIENNLKFVISIIILLAFTGLMWKLKDGAFEEMEKSTKLEGYEVIQYTKTCIDDKEFILRVKGLTINLDMDGKPIPCNLEE